MSRSQKKALPRLDPALESLVASVRRSLPGDLYIVGGFVRDVLIGGAPADLDLAITGDAHGAAEAIAASAGGSLFPLDDARGQYRIVLRPDAPVQYVDVASLRGEIEADLGLRDFTIDAMAVPFEQDGSLGAVIDPFGGLDDLKRRSVRLTSESALTEDPLRLLRAVRLATELGFELDPDTQDALYRHAPEVRLAAPERQRDELCRILATDNGAGGLRLLDAAGLLDMMLPEVTAGRGVEQPESHHHWDVFDHSIEAVAALDVMFGSRPTKGRRAAGLHRCFADGLDGYHLVDYLEAESGGQPRHVLIKLAALLHDVGKPGTKAVHDGRVRFLGHEEQGARLAAQVCARLRFGSRATRFVTLLVEEHMRPTQLSNPGHAPSERAVYRYFRDLGDAAIGCLVLRLADTAAAMGPRLTLDYWRRLVAYTAYLIARHEAQRLVRPGGHLVRGDTLIEALALEPGPLVARLLAAIDEAAAAGELRSPDEAIAHARSLRDQWAREPASAAGRR